MTKVDSMRVIAIEIMVFAFAFVFISISSTEAVKLEAADLAWHSRQLREAQISSLRAERHRFCECGYRLLDWELAFYQSSTEARFLHGPPGHRFSFDVDYYWSVFEKIDRLEGR